MGTEAILYSVACIILIFGITAAVFGQYYSNARIDGKYSSFEEYSDRGNRRD